MESNLYEYNNTTTVMQAAEDFSIDGFKLGILKICLFSTFFVLGLIGNLLVLIGIGLNKGMQTPTNLLIFNLALADILFIIVCIPTTLFSFFGRWPFTEYGCKLAQFINHLSAFMSIYLLVFMSFDRYIAVVFAVDPISNYRTRRNTMICIIALWLIGITMSMIIGSLFTVITFGDDQSAAAMYCLLRYLKPNFSSTTIVSNRTEIDLMNFTKNFTDYNQTEHLKTSNEPIQTLPIEASLYWLGFVIFLYALPLTIIVILYGLMLKFLRGARGQSVGRSKRRATRMILAVILTYALCWFFMQLLFISNVILSRNISHNFATYMDILTMFANIFAYLNSCTNPILYGFMSKNFRSSFIDLLCCRYSKRHLFGHNDSLRNRHATDNYMNNLNLKYRKKEYMIRSSVVSRLSQFNPVTGVTMPSDAPGFSSSSRLTAEFLPKYEQNDSPTHEDPNHQSIDNNSSCQITVGTQTNTLNKAHRKRKHSDRSPVISYCSLSPNKTSEVLCT